MNYATELKKIEDIKKHIFDSLYKEINDLPQNEDIKNIHELPSGGVCFTVNFSQLIGRSWSPASFNYKKLYELIIKTIQKSNNPLDKLKEIINNKKVEYTYYVNSYPFKQIEPLDDKVIAYLNQVIAE